MQSEYRDMISSVFLFRGLDFEELERDYSICSQCRYEDFDEGTLVYSANCTRDSIGIVLSGRIRISAIVNGNEAMLKYAVPGEAFGAAAVFQTGPHKTECIADTHSEILFLPAELLNRLIDNNSEIARNYINFLSNRITYLNQKIAIYTAGTAEDKLMVYIAANMPVGGSIFIKSMSMLASQLSISRASLYRAVDTLIEKNIIVYEANTFRIIDKRKLDSYMDN